MILHSFVSRSSPLPICFGWGFFVACRRFNGYLVLLVLALHDWRAFFYALYFVTLCNGLPYK